MLLCCRLRLRPRSGRLVMSS